MTAPKKGNAASTSTNVRVVARIRPLSKKELEIGSKESITSLASDNNNSEEHYDPSITECMQVLDNGQKRFFELDRVFAQKCTQSEIYHGCGAKLAVTDELFKGFNCTILAYGQTGAGKTFTMGTAAANPDGTIGEDDGMIPRAVYDLFDAIQNKCDGNAKVEMSYMEIYNEEIRDLMATNDNNNNHQKKKLMIRERLNGEVYVQGVEYQAVTSPQDIGRVMDEASQRRVVASTAMNAVSSRSHAICTLRICGVLENDDKFSSKLTLVDLAGSERIKKTGAQGNRRQEGININKGLFVLGQVVSALSDAGRGGLKRKPPYRDSKLTRLLQDSLGGNSRTIMVACCSPADYNTEESINTLRYATSARNIKNTATRNLVKQISPEEAAKLARQNQLLQKQIAELQALLKDALANNNAKSDDDNDNDDDEVDGPSSNGPSGDDQQTAETMDSSSSSLEGSSHAAVAKDTAAATPHHHHHSTPAEVAVEVPALHMEIETLKQQVQELQEVEKDNIDLRQQLSEAQGDAEAARKAAEQLSNIMDKIQELKEDEIEKKRLEYKHKKKEEQWIDFVHNLLKQQGQQLVKLWNDFELVQRLVTQPVVIKQVGNKTYAVKPKLGYQGSSSNKRGSWFGDKSAQQQEETVAVDDPDEYQMQLLKDHIKFFKNRMRDTQAGVEKECDDLEGMKASLLSVQRGLLAEIGADETLQEALTKENNLLDQLTTMLLQPATVLAAQVPESVLGGDGNTVATSATRGGGGHGIPQFIDIASGNNEDDKTIATATTVGGEKGTVTKRSGWLFRWKGGEQQQAETAAVSSHDDDHHDDDSEANDDDSDEDIEKGSKEDNDNEGKGRTISDDKSVLSQASWFALSSKPSAKKQSGGWWKSLTEEADTAVAAASASASSAANSSDDDDENDAAAAAAAAAPADPAEEKEESDDDDGETRSMKSETSKPHGGKSQGSWLGGISKKLSLRGEGTPADPADEKEESDDDDDDDDGETRSMKSETSKPHGGKSQGSWLGGISKKLSLGGEGTPAEEDEKNEDGPNNEEEAETTPALPPASDTSEKQQGPPRRGVKNQGSWLGKVSQMVHLEGELDVEAPNSEEIENEANEQQPEEKVADGTQKRGGWFSRLRTSSEELRETISGSSADHLPVINEADNAEDTSSVAGVGDNSEDDADSDCSHAEGSTGGESEDEDSDPTYMDEFLESSERSDPLADLLMTRNWEPKKKKSGSVDKPAQSEEEQEQQPAVPVSS